MLKFVACPGCEQEHLLPAVVSFEVKLECPQCGETLDLASYLADHHSVWKVIQAPSTHPLANSAIAEAVANSADPITGAATDYSDEELRLVEEETSTNSASGEIKLGEVVERPAAKQPWLETQPITHEQYERIKRKNRSPIWSMLQIALGGLAAFPLALLILWWGLGRDFGGTGPKVAEYAPWLVPSKFHPESEAEASENNLPSAKPSPGQSGFRNFDDVLAPDSAKKDRNGKDRAESSPPALPTLQASSGSDSDAGSSASATPPVASLDRAAMLAANEKASVTKSTDAPKVEDNIFARITRCEQQIESWRTAVLSGEGDRRQIAQDIYGELLAISENLGSFPEDSPIFRVIRDKLQPVSRAVKRQPDVRKIIVQGAQHWSSNLETDQVNPLALICEIEAVEETPDGWIVSPLAKDCPDVITTIEIPSSIAPQLEPGQQLLLLGLLEATAGKNGDEPQAPKRPNFRAYYLHGQ
ncbi:MAG: hypothetical protein AB8B50_10230 [Pirellulaceae bacterium]